MSCGCLVHVILDRRHCMPLILWSRQNETSSLDFFSCFRCVDTLLHEDMMEDNAGHKDCCTRLGWQSEMAKLARADNENGRMAQEETTRKIQNWWKWNLRLSSRGCCSESIFLSLDLTISFSLSERSISLLMDSLVVAVLLSSSLSSSLSRREEEKKGVLTSRSLTWGRDFGQKVYFTVNKILRSIQESFYSPSYTCLFLICLSFFSRRLYSASSLMSKIEISCRKEKESKGGLTKTLGIHFVSKTRRPWHHLLCKQVSLWCWQRLSEKKSWRWNNMSWGQKYKSV